MEIDEKILTKLEILKKEFEQCQNDLCYEEVLLDVELTKKLEKRINQLSPIINEYQEYLNILDKCANIKNSNNKNTTNTLDIELRKNLLIEKLEKDISRLDAKHEKIIIEITYVLDKFNNMAKIICDGYKNYCQNNDFEILSYQETQNGYILDVIGQNCFKRFINENGIHKTDESSVFVLVYPFVDKEDISFEEKDLKVDVYRSNGAGGQNVNKVSTAIRITHLPTNIVATCQDERSQFQNKERALANLKEKVNKFLENKYEKNLKKLKDKYSNKTIIKKYDIQNNLIVNISTKQKIYLQDFVAGKKL